MRVLLSTWAWRSHFYCLVPLGWALQAAGHDVRVASQPSMVGPITTAGLAAVPLGEDLDFAEVFGGTIGKVGQLDDTEHGDALVPEITADGGVVRYAEAILDDLVAFGRAYRPDLMVWEPFNLAAAVASAALGVPGVQHLWGPDSSTTLRLDHEKVVGPLAARCGLAADDVSRYGSYLLDPVPPPMQVPLHGPSRPIRFVPYNGPAVLPDWLRKPPRRPRICLTAGTMMAGAGLLDELDVPGTVRALSTLDVDVVVAVDDARLGDQPDNVHRITAPLALRLLLPTCAALVQQGGAGTTMTALDCGVPQLILPHVSDQYFNGERLAATGAGTWLAPAEAGAAAIRDRVADLVENPRWREAAEVMRDRMHAMPSPADVVPMLTGGRP